MRVELKLRVAKGVRGCFRLQSELFNHWTKCLLFHPLRNCHQMLLLLVLLYVLPVYLKVWIHVFYDWLDFISFSLSYLKSLAKFYKFVFIACSYTWAWKGVFFYITDIELITDIHTVMLLMLFFELAFWQKQGIRSWRLQRD